MRILSIILALVIIFTTISSCKKDTNTLCKGVVVPTDLTTTVAAGIYVTFNWFTPTMPDGGYNLQYRVAGSNTWYTFQVSYPPLQLTRLAPNTNYEWRMQSLCIYDSSAYSNTATFQTGNIIGMCNYDSSLYFYATSAVGNMSTMSLTAYDTFYASSYLSFVFSSYPTSSGTYRLVAPGSHISGNTAVMTAYFDISLGSISPSTFTSSGTDSVFANVTLTGGKLILTLPKVKVASIANPADTGYFYNTIINQQ